MCLKGIEVTDSKGVHNAEQHEREQSGPTHSELLGPRFQRGHWNRIGQLTPGFLALHSYWGHWRCGPSVTLLGFFLLYSLGANVINNTEVMLWSHMLFVSLIVFPFLLIPFMINHFFFSNSINIFFSIHESHMAGTHCSMLNWSWESS